MPKVCAAFMCDNKSDKNSNKCFHRFPAESNLKKKWESSLKRKDFVATRTSYLCSDHFIDSAYSNPSGNRRRLKATAIPTLFVFTSAKNRFPELQEASTENNTATARSDVTVEKNIMESHQIKKRNVSLLRRVLSVNRSQKTIRHKKTLEKTRITFSPLAQHKECLPKNFPLVKQYAEKVVNETTSLRKQKLQEQIRNLLRQNRRNINKMARINKKMKAIQNEVDNYRKLLGLPLPSDEDEEAYCSDCVVTETDSLDHDFVEEMMVDGTCAEIESQCLEQSSSKPHVENDADSLSDTEN